MIICDVDKTGKGIAENSFVHEKSKFFVIRDKFFVNEPLYKLKVHEVEEGRHEKKCRTTKIFLRF